jgi:hypothetical protein
LKAAFASIKSDQYPGVLRILVRITSLSAGPLFASDWFRFVDLSSDSSGTSGFENSDIAPFLSTRIGIFGFSYSRTENDLVKEGGQAAVRDGKWFVTLRKVGLRVSFVIHIH